MKGISCCGECAYYSKIWHRCRRGATVESDSKKQFFDDCPLPNAINVPGGCVKITFCPGQVRGMISMESETYDVYLGDMDVVSIMPNNFCKTPIIKRKFTLIEY